MMNRLFYVMRGIGVLYEWCAPFRHFSLSPEIDKSQYEILIRSKNFHLTNLRVSVILAVKFKRVHAVNERKSEVRSLREPVDGENRCDVSVIYHS